MKRGVGMVLGKFYPPHRGHVYLCEFALAHVERLHIVVGTLSRETIPGAVRHSLVQELVPGATVHHLTDENPQDPSEHPDFWRIWRESLLRILPEPVDFVFASEPYGERLASELGARFVPVDPARAILPIRATAIRQDPLSAWEDLPRAVRPYFVKRVCLMGPESTGKTTLAASLARDLQTVWVPEYARTHLAQQEGQPVLADFAPIALGQAASEQSLARDANRVLICDSDALTTALYAEALCGEVPAEVQALAEAGRYDLTLLTAPDVPYVPEPLRYLPHARERFFERCVQALEAHGRRYHVLSGGWAARRRSARAAIDALLAPAPAPRLR
jgi:HTH-type transcriptional repressor of NAD biosynthesis genes